MKNFDDLLTIMKRLRRECPWDRKQTPQSLRQYILEESFEVIESIDEENWDELKKELGDLLLQIVFQSTIAEEKNRFSIADVVEHINNKLVVRHPHVFGDKTVENERDVENNWEHIKIRTEQRDSLLSGVPQPAPALIRAQRMQEKASGVGFDWDRTEDVLKKIEEEFGELRQALEKKDGRQIEAEIGDLLFSIVNLSRFYDVVAEDALRLTVKKFQSRFRYIEKHYKNDHKMMEKASLKELDRLWDEAKKKEKNG